MSGFMYFILSTLLVVGLGRSVWGLYKDIKEVSRRKKARELVYKVLSDILGEDDHEEDKI